MIFNVFPTANFSAKISTLLWFISYIPFPVSGYTSRSRVLWKKLLACLLSNTAMAYGAKFIVYEEKTGQGIHWSTIWEPVDVNMCVGHLLFMLIFDSILYMIIALYVEKVYPGDYGIPLPWYFPFQKSFWLGEKPKAHETILMDQQYFESPPADAVISVELRQLRKIFNKKTAVNGISLNLYKNEITILLGHNGAGKTTTISMLIGMLNPTSGEILIDGIDIRKNTNLVQSKMGLCPQHNILFDELTVNEHIIFYNGIKGVKLNRLVQRVNYDIIEQLHLENDLNVKAKNLSGGVKRQLSVGLAFCGNPSFVLLDEPSSGKYFF